MLLADEQVITQDKKIRLRRSYKKIQSEQNLYCCTLEHWIHFRYFECDISNQKDKSNYQRIYRAIIRFVKPIALWETQI